MRSWTTFWFGKFLRLAYYLLYHQFAWAYDFVAALVSGGLWQRWTLVSLDFLSGGERCLELGHGPGHLQIAAMERGIDMFGIDPSGPMSRMASRRIREWVKTSSHYYSGKSPNLSRAYAQHLPFRKRIFDTVISTFPSEYIFDPLTIQEIRRILRPGGRWVIVISAWPTGKNFVSRMLAWVFRITGLMNIQSNLIQAQIRDRFPGATSFHEVPVGDSIVFVIVNKELA